jgi:outer membrane protein OmpA-like peptidoglycan-associated protein
MQRAPSTRTLTGGLGLVLALALASPAAAATEPATSEAEFTFNSVGIGVGFNWGKGKLTYEDGREVPFKINRYGYKILDVGVFTMSPSGTVYNLQDPEDFGGLYTAIQGSAAVIGGGTAMRLQNENGVIVHLAGAAWGVGVTLATEGFEVELGEIPEPPEPDPPPVAAAPPPPPPPPAAPDPCDSPVVLGAVVFELGSAKLKTETEEALGPVADRLNECPEEGVEIAGYTDSTGNDAVNLKVSRERADSVRDYLAARGVAMDRMTSKGFGSEDPVGSNKTEEGRANNRRVVIRPTD